MNIEGSYSPHGKQAVHFRGSHDSRGIKQLQPSEIKKKIARAVYPVFFITMLIEKGCLDLK